jgi:protein-tyrosine phosphatase
MDQHLSAGGEEEQEEASAGGKAKEHVLYTVSLQYNKTLSLAGGVFEQGGRPWWTPVPIPNSSDDVPPLTLVLGALPLMSEGHLEILTQATPATSGFNRVSAVLSMNKAFELEPSMVATPVAPRDWKAAGVDQLVMQVQDFHKPSSEQFDRCCRFIDDHLRPDSTVYVHCKAGRGRSCAAVCCYLVHRGMSAQAAMDHVRQKRPHVSMGASQVESVTGFEEYRRTRAGAGGGSDVGLPVAGSRPHAGVPARGADVAASASSTGPSVEDGPSCECWKKKPTLKTWELRFVRIKGKSLQVYDDKKTFLEQPTVYCYTGPRDNVRGSSVPDLTGCQVIPGVQKFLLSGTYYLMTLRNDSWQSPVGPEASFCFQAEYDRDRFVAAVTNVAAGRKWDQSQPGVVDQVPVPEPEPSGR